MGGARREEGRHGWESEVDTESCGLRYESASISNGCFCR